MAEEFNVGQFRRTQTKKYSESITFDQDKIINRADVIDFYDPLLSLSGANVVDSLNSYYLYFSAGQIPDREQEFTIELRNKDPLSEDVQSVRTFKIPKGTSNTTFELIFNPNATYDSIVFVLRRDALDFKQYNEADQTNGRFLKIEIKKFERILNIIDTELKTLFPKIINGLKKVGIQGPPGLLFALNGEEMHVGRSGIYELYYDGITIKSIGFVLKESLITQDGLDFFIMDFKYY